MAMVCAAPGRLRTVIEFDHVLLEQHVLDRSRDAVVLAAGPGADHELDISFRFPGGLRV